VIICGLAWHAVKHVNTRFPDDLYEAIAAAADAEERPVGSWLRIAAKEKLARDGNLIYNAGGGEEVEFKPGPSHGFPIIATNDGIREDTAYVVSAVQDPRDPAKKKLDAVKITVSARVEVQAPHQPPYRRRVCCMWGEGSMNLLRKTVADTVLGLTLHAAKAGEPVKISLTNDFERIGSFTAGEYVGEHVLVGKRGDGRVYKVRRRRVWTWQQ
jgi:hypothetical protein